MLFNNRAAFLQRKEGFIFVKTLFDIFFTFFRIGAVTFGGGYSMLPILQREVVEKKDWATDEDLLDYYAIGQCLPGIIAVNTAIFIGYKTKKVPGSIAASLGVIAPSIIVITLIAMLLSNFSDILAVQYAFKGIRIAVAALITEAVIKLFKSNVLPKKDKDAPSGLLPFLKRCWLQLAVCVLVFVLVAVGDVSAAYVVIGAALAGVAYGVIGKVRAEK